MSFAKPNKQDANDGPSLRCSAHGCPMKWAVKIESPLCSYHAWEDPVQWHSITESLRRNGAWQRPAFPESHTVADMKTRVRSGHRFTSAAERIAA